MLKITILKQLFIRVISLWKYKGFILGMVLREFRIRYLGSLLGSIWSILNPMAMIFIYTIIFSRVMKTRLAGVDDSMAYGIFLCSGVLTWGFFAELLGRSVNIFIEQADFLKKVNFPRITLPAVLFFSTLINFIIVFSIFLAFIFLLGRMPGRCILSIIPLLIIQQTFAIGLGLILGVLNVFFRDIGHILGIILQFWFWLTPIVYPIHVLSENIRSIIELNPMTDLTIAYQQIFLKNECPNLSNFIFHGIASLCVISIGYLLFKKLSGDIVDEL